MSVESKKSRRLHLVAESRFVSEECSSIAAVRSLSFFCNYLPQQLRGSPSPALEGCSNLTTSLLAEIGRCSDVIEPQQHTQVRNRDNVRAGCNLHLLSAKWCVIADLRRRKRKLHHTFMYLHWHLKILKYTNFLL